MPNLRAGDEAALGTPAGLALVISTRMKLKNKITKESL